MALICLLCWIPFSSLQAQKKVLPVRINQKWGYISVRGKIVIPPKYDGLGDENLPYHGMDAQARSPFRLVSVGDRCGLLDQHRRELFPPEYHRIYVLADTLFAVRNDTGFFLMNHRRHILMDLRLYDDVQLPQPGNNRWTFVLLVKKHLKWGLVDQKGRQLIRPQYARIIPQRDCPGMFVVMKETGGYKGMVDRENKPVFNFEHRNLMALSEHCFARWDREGWSMIERNGKKINAQYYGSIQRINANIYLVSQDKGIALFSVKDKKLVTQFDVNYQYKALDEHYFIRTRRDSVALGALDGSGKILIVNGKAVQDMRVVSPEWYAVSQSNVAGKRFWGLWKPGLDTLAVPCIYARIYPFKDSLAIIELDKKKGVINLALKEIIPPDFKSIQIDRNQIKAETDTSMVVFQLKSGAEIGKAEMHGNVQTIKIIEIDSFVEMERSVIKKYNSYEDFDLSRGEPGTFWINGYAWKYNSNNETYQLYHGDSLFLPMVAEQVVVLKKLHLAMVFARDLHTRNAFTHMMTRDRNTPLCRMALFDYFQGKFITGFDFLGLRYHDFTDSLSTAVCIDLEGKMGLLRTDGQQMKAANGAPLRYSYIGDFVDGRAHFCANGRFESTETEDVTHTWELPPMNCLFELTTPDYGAASFKFREYQVTTTDSTEKSNWGVLDAEGKTLIQPQYDFVQAVTANGVIALKNKYWGVVNFKGDTLLGFRYRWISDYGEHWKIVVRSPKQFFFSSQAHRPAETMPALLPESLPKDSARLVSANIGNYEKVESWPNGWIKVRYQKKYGVLNQQKQTIIPVQCADVAYLNDQLIARKSIDKQQWTVVDSTNKPLSGRVYDWIRPYAQERSLAQVNGKPCIADKTGNIQYLAPGDRPTGWAAGFAVVDTVLRSHKHAPRMRYVYLNKEGVNEFGSAYWDIKPFEHGLGQVRRGYFWGTVNQFGLYVTPPKYILYDLKSDGVHVRVPTLMGLADKNGKIIIPPEYDRIEVVGSRFFRVEQGDAIGYRNADGTWVWEMSR
jgi:hypothetical protein